MNKNQRNRTIIFISIIAALFLASLACGTSDEPELISTAPQEEEDVGEGEALPEAEAEPESEQSPSSFEIGDVISIGDKTLIVLGWEDVPGNQFFTPDEGYKYIAVDVILVNTADTNKSTSSILQMKVKDETAQQYPVDIMAQSLALGGKIEGEMLPGEKIRGKVGFQVPEDGQKLELVFDAKVFGTGKVFVNLGSEPKMVDAPAEIPGETEQETYTIGESIEMNDILLTVNEVSIIAGDEFNTPSEGYKYLSLDLTLVNNSSNPINISSLLQMFVKDSQCRNFSLDFMATSAAGASSPDGEYAPGETIRGQVGYQVPADETQFVFSFDAGFWRTGRILVAFTVE